MPDSASSPMRFAQRARMTDTHVKPCGSGVFSPPDPSSAAEKNPEPSWASLRALLIDGVVDRR